MSQYIGARYVPKFMGTYDNTQAYENMVVVDNGLGTSYISKVPVPAGTPLTDTNYWALYGASNGAIINLQNQIGDLSQLNTSDQTSLVAATNEVNATINSYINDNDIVNRPTLFVGDSYGDGNDEFIQIAINLLGMTNAHNLAVSGTGFTVGNNGNGFLDQIQNYAGDRDEIEAIYVCGGLNDSHPDSMGTLVSNITAFAAYALANYPNARLYLAYVGVARDGAPATAGRTLFYREMCKFYYLKALNFISADLSGYLGISNEYMDVDGVHPNVRGQSALGVALLNFMRGNLPKVLCPYSTVVTTPATGISSVDNFYYHIDGDVFTILMPEGFHFRVPTSTQLTSTPVTVCTFSTVYFNRPLSFIGTMRLDLFNSKTYQNVTGVWAFYEDKLTFGIAEINSTNTGYETYTADANNSAVRMIGSQYQSVDADGVI